ncbi:MAG TPA: hypothetical protein VJ228_10725, partial [Candidatus Acidoferrales bacterium]|nr:hypothetical protein [Candidatus Acidoferrales bacterium]
CAHGDAAEHQYGAQAMNFQFTFEIWTAICQLRWQRLIGRWGAANSRSDIRVFESQAIAAMLRSRLIREAGAKQGFVQKVAGTIAGKHASRAIAPVCRWRKAEDQEFGSAVTKARKGPPPVIAIEKGATFGSRHLLAVTYQARTLAAMNDFLVQLV